MSQNCVIHSIFLSYTLYVTLQLAFGYFQELDDRINYVATKVVHLGDQLEGINAPRSRAIEAQELMKYFDEFAGNSELVSRVFNDQSQVSCSMAVQNYVSAVKLI